MKVYYITGKEELPSAFEGEINQAVEKLRKLNTKEKVLKEAYNLIISRYRGKRFHTYLRLPGLFSSGIQDLWNRSGFMHCTNQNYLLHYLLVKSGKFKDSDVKARWTNYWVFSPHQYLRVRIDKDRFVNVDPWSAAYGIKFGDYSHGLHTRTKAEVKK